MLCVCYLNEMSDSFSLRVGAAENVGANGAMSVRAACACVFWYLLLVPGTSEHRYSVLLCTGQNKQEVLSNYASIKEGVKHWVCEDVMGTGLFAAAHLIYWTL